MIIDSYEAIEFVKKLTIHQLQNYFIDIDTEIIESAIPKVVDICKENYKAVNMARYCNDGNPIFDTNCSVTWMIFLYRLAHEIGANPEYADGGQAPKEADQIYYLNKIMHSIDWYYQINLPEHFMCEHPMGSVLGKASYHDYLMIYQGTTIGGNRREGKIFYPTIGNNVLLYANATVLGDTYIGNNVIISGNTYLLDEKIPDNCIVFGKTPNIFIKEKSIDEIRDMTSHIWKMNEDFDT